MKKLTALVLILASLGTFLLISCDGGTVAPMTSENDVIRDDVSDDIPAGLKFNGETIVFLNREGEENLKPFAEKLTGEKLNDAIYNRKAHTEERLNVKIENREIKSSHNEVHFIDELLIAVQSQLDEYQIAQESPYGFGGADALEGGILFNLNNKERFPYIDLTKKYYYQGFIEEAMYDGMLYFVAGDICSFVTSNMYATFFNKTLADSIGYKDQDLYGLVRSGGWTIDKQLEISAKMYTDVTGNGKTEDDIFGMTLGNLVSVNPYMSSFEVNIAGVDDSGEFTFMIDYAHHTEVLEKLYSVFFERGDILVYDDYEYETDEGPIWARLNEKFANEETLFVTLRLQDMGNKEIRNMKSDFGILPIPKYTETQDDYYSMSYGTYDVYGIVSTTVETEIASAVFEAFSSYSYQYIAPTYYNDLLNGQYTRDLDTTEMLDLITGNMKVDTGEIYNHSLDKVAQDSFRYLLTEEKSTNVKRYWAQNGKRHQKKLEKFVANWNRLKEAGY